MGILQRPGRFSVSSPGFKSEFDGKLRIVAAGDNTQIFQYDLSLEPNTKYVFSFAAYSRSGHDVDVSVAKHSPPYTGYGLEAMRFDLDTTWKVFTAEFTTINFTSKLNDARLRLWFAPYAAEGDEYHIDNVVLTPVIPMLLAPAPIAPAPWATDQPTDVTLRWSRREGASSYAVEVALDSGFAARVASDTAVADTQYQLSSLKNLTTYYWHVRSRSGASTSSFSPISPFTTGLGRLSIPVLIPNPDTLRPVSFAVAWRPVTGASRYHLQLATDDRFTAIVVNDSTVADTSLNIGPLQYATRYLLRIRAIGPAGGSPFSAPSEFITVPAALTAPTVTGLPIQNGLMPLEFAVAWSGVFGATRYHLQIAPDSLYGTLEVDDSTITDTVKGIGPLRHATTYFMRLRSIGPAGNSAFGSSIRFTVSAFELSIPVLVPLPGRADQQPVTVTLVWQPSPGATHYHLQLSADSLFTMLVMNDSTVTDTARRLGPLLDAATYYIRLRALNSIGRSPYSKPMVFTTSAAELAVPFLVAPPGQNTNSPVVTVIRWLPVVGAMRYHLQLATDLNFKLLVHNDSTLTDTMAQVGPLSHGTTYFVRVRASNDRARSAFSLPHGFSTIQAPPSTPAGILPASEPQRTSVLLSWPATSGAIMYHIQVAEDSLFPAPCVNDSTVMDTVRAVNSLNPSTRYFARVRAKGVGGMSAFSATLVFTTAGSPPPTDAPRDYFLEQNFPNPFNPSTKIRYDVPAHVHVRIALFNTLGQLVKIVVDADHTPGTYTIELTSNRLASGTYFYVFEAGKYVQTRRLLVLK